MMTEFICHWTKLIAVDRTTVFVTTYVSSETVNPGSKFAVTFGTAINV